MKNQPLYKPNADLTTKAAMTTMPMVIPAIHRAMRKVFTAPSCPRGVTP